MLEADAKEFDDKVIRAYAEDHSWARWAEKVMQVMESAIDSHQA
jgi:hypothetical protein